MTNLKIVKASPQYIDQLCAVGAECGLSEWTVDGYANEMQRTDSIILIAEDSLGQVAGFIVGRSSPHSGNPGDALGEIYNIGTRPSIRKAGIGTMLLTSFLEICRNRGVNQVWLEVRASNYDAKAFYTTRGFSKSGIRRNFYTAPVEDAELMFIELQTSKS